MGSMGQPGLLSFSPSLSTPAGNEQMKLENFEAAVHLYGKAIELNPANAVYFCNRCGWGWRARASHRVGCGLHGELSAALCEVWRRCEVACCSHRTLSCVVSSPSRQMDSTDALVLMPLVDMQAVLQLL